MSRNPLKFAVNGTLMRGLELNANLLEAGAIFLEETASCYRLWSIGDRHPAMMRVEDGGAAITVEVWAVPPAGLAEILNKEPAGLCIGKVELANGEWVLGVLGEAICCETGVEITHYGGWRSYIAQKNCLMENRGFEPLTSAVRSQRSTN
jgi:hypothetical protein